MITHPLDLDIVERLRLEEEFFSQPFLMSYSGLNKLAYSPGAFYQHYVLRQKVDTTDKAALEGKALHCKLLTPERFDDEFIVLPDSFPSENPKKVLDILYEQLKKFDVSLSTMDMTTIISSDAFKNTMLDILKEQNLYQSLKTDDQRLDKMMVDKNLDYLEFLIKSSNRSIIDSNTVKFAERAKDTFLGNEYVRSIMGLEAFTPHKIKVYNELALVSLPEHFNFGLKGIIDNLVIDYDNEIIRINDVKKTSKALDSFQDSIEYYNYWIQAAMYFMLIRENKETLYSVDYPTEFRFIVIDPYMHIGVIKISDETMNKWIDDTHNLLKVAKYHFDKKDFSLPYKFLTSTSQEYVI